MSKAKKSKSSESKAPVLGIKDKKSNLTKPKKNTPILFTLDDVDEAISKQQDHGGAVESDAAKLAREKAEKLAKAEAKPVKKQILKAASINDILGFNPNDKKSKPVKIYDEDKVPKKHRKYFKALLQIRDHVMECLDLHSQETLKRSSKDDTGDLSSYSQHMADAGTDTFDRDFALSLVSSEQDALFEVEAAIQRIFEDNYGICEITGEKIPDERLMAIPFTRYSLKGQQEQEKNRTFNKERGGVFAETSLEESAKYTGESDD